VVLLGPPAADRWVLKNQMSWCLLMRSLAWDRPRCSACSIVDVLQFESLVAKSGVVRDDNDVQDKQQARPKTGKKPRWRFHCT
jgi:hypothetical protein